VRISLDTNIFVYATGTSAEPKREIARDLIRRAARADCVLALQSLAEFFNVAIRRAGLKPDEAKVRINEWRAVFPIHAANFATLAAAIDAVRDHGLSFWDAMLWATVRDAGCRLLLTEDFQDGRKLDGVIFVNPFSTEGRAAINATLPPLPTV
jgi:predicted nucleic acid-binding protein